MFYQFMWEWEEKSKISKSAWEQHFTITWDNFCESSFKPIQTHTFFYTFNTQAVKQKQQLLRERLLSNIWKEPIKVLYNVCIQPTATLWHWTDCAEMKVDLKDKIFHSTASDSPRSVCSVAKETSSECLQIFLQLCMLVKFTCPTVVFPRKIFRFYAQQKTSLKQDLFIKMVQVIELKGEACTFYKILFSIVKYTKTTMWLCGAFITLLHLFEQF